MGYLILFENELIIGEVSEWLKEHAWKACVRLRVPRVRISPSPPVFISNNKEAWQSG